ncbi:hypothetical protein V2J09_020668 [Rumex salicifolius]
MFPRVSWDTVACVSSLRRSSGLLTNFPFGGLEKAWGKFKLSDSEASIEKFEEEINSNDKRRISMGLAGKLMGQGDYDKTALKRTIELIWKPRRGMVMKKIKDNTLIFQIFSAEDKVWVLNHQPWNFNGNLLALTELEGFENPENLSFNKTPLWIETENQAEKWDSVMKVRAKVDLRKPLVRGMMASFGDSSPIWLGFRYQYLPDFCYSCGLLGHID